MKLKIFALAFGVCFSFCFTAAMILVLNFGGKAPVSEEKPEEPPVFLEEKSAVFLLAFIGEDKKPEAFSLINFDAGNGRIPVFSFSKKAALSYGGVYVSAGELFSAVSPEIFAGTVENNLKIELSGYFIWDRDCAEAVISKAGSFDYVLPKEISYTVGERKVNLASGVQNMTGKKLCDVAEYPKFSEAERCDTLSRMGAAFFNRRLKRFLPESSVYTTLFSYAITDVSAYDKARYAKIIEVLSNSKSSISGHITNDTEKELSSGLLYFSDETKERVKKYFA